jgi:hypothetical protein
VTYEIRDGWVHGELPGPEGRTYKVEKEVGPRPGGQPFIPLTNPRAMVLHTTEGHTVNGAVATLRSNFDAPHFVVGEDRIVQMRPLTAQGATLRDNGLPFHPNSVGWQVETVGFAKEEIHRLTPLTLHPLVAVAAFALEELGVPLLRPDGWRDDLRDIKTILASDNARRKSRTAAMFKGWVMHLEIPDQQDTWHWDAGAFDFATFFEMVRAVGGDELTPEQEEALKRMTTFLDTLTDELGGHVEEPGPGDDRASPAGAAQRVAKTVINAEKA